VPGTNNLVLPVLIGVIVSNLCGLYLPRHAFMICCTIGKSTRKQVTVLLDVLGTSYVCFV
jgi:hypothetical protein